jgi:tRNA (adenine22-N1)-methyltransferase
MGGELIVKILSEAPWLRDPRYTLILQPQTDVDLLRLWLSENGFTEDRADLVYDSGHLYCALRARYTGERDTLTPGRRYVSPALLESGSPLLPEYIARTKATLGRIAAGLSRADANPEPKRLDTLKAAIRELEEMERDYVNR